MRASIAACLASSLALSARDASSFIFRRYSSNFLISSSSFPILASETFLLSSASEATCLTSWICLSSKAISFLPLSISPLIRSSVSSSSLMFFSKLLLCLLSPSIACLSASISACTSSSVLLASSAWAFRAAISFSTALLLSIVSEVASSSIFFLLSVSLSSFLDSSS